MLGPGVESLCNAETSRLDAVCFSYSPKSRDVIALSMWHCDFIAPLSHRCRIFSIGSRQVENGGVLSQAVRGVMQSLESTSRYRRSTAVLVSDSMMAMFPHISCFANP